MGTDEQLRKETEKWLERLRKSYKDIELTGKLSEEDLHPIFENIVAYIKDCKYFLDKGDLVRAFEAVIYAWGLLEACQHLKLIKK